MSSRVLSASSNVLVTGVTGLIGGEIVRRLAASHRGKIFALIRPQQGQSPRRRLEQRLRRGGEQHSEELAQGIYAVAGDITQRLWGLSRNDLAEVLPQIDIIIHCAADTSFIRDRAVHETNIVGIGNLIELAKCCPSNPLVAYMSTATNVGNVSNCSIREDEGCQPANAHHNGYTYSKALAEQLLRESGLQVLTLRPSIVLSAGLPDAAFARNILWFAPLVGEFQCLPIDPASRLDLIPVSFVVDSALRILACPRRSHDCYHISAGPRDSLTNDELFAHGREAYGWNEVTRLLPPNHWTPHLKLKYVRTPQQRKIFFALRYYLPFLNMDVVYDNTRLRRDLGTDCSTIPPPTQYLHELLGQIPFEQALMEAARP